MPQFTVTGTAHYVGEFSYTIDAASQEAAKEVARVLVERRGKIVRQAADVDFRLAYYDHVTAPT